MKLHYENNLVLVTMQNKMGKGTICKIMIKMLMVTSKNARQKVDQQRDKNNNA